MKRKILEISQDQELNKIFTKAHFLEEADASLLEGTLQFLLVEKITEKESKKVADALGGSREQIEKIEKYLNGLKTKGFDTTKIPSINNMLKGMSSAIDKAQGDFAAVNFDSGKVANFMGNKMTAPSIAKAAIAIQTKANQFLTGFTDALQNIEDNLVPLAKDDSVKNAPMRDIAGQGGIPDADTLEKGIKAAISSALKPKGILAKIKSFLSKNMSGTQSKILKTIPELDPDVASQELADAIMDTSLSIFDASDLKDTKVPMRDVGELAQDVVESEPPKSSEKSGEASDTSDPAEAPPVDEKTAEEEQSTAEKELKDAVKEEAAESQSPKEAALGALDSWANGLSQTSLKSLTAKNRLRDLKDIVGTALDDSAKAIEGQVAAAIQAWREEHEETLVKGRRFAKKNFDELESLISSLAANMLKKSNESKLNMTESNIKKIVFEFLNRKFYKNSDEILSENKTKHTEEELIIYKMNKMAGLN